MAKRSLTVKIEGEGVRETLAKFRSLPKDASRILKERTRKLSEKIADRARAAAASDFAPQSHLLAPTVKAVTDRVPAVKAGGATRVGSSRVAAYKVLFGAEFGSDVYRQFGRQHSGREGHWFFPVIENNQGVLISEWEKIADDVVDEFTEGR